VRAAFDSDSADLEVYGRPNQEGNGSRSNNDPGFLGTKSSTFQDLGGSAADTITVGSEKRENQQFCEPGRDAADGRLQ
jgi:hypothetical protein